PTSASLSSNVLSVAGSIQDSVYPQATATVNIVNSGVITPTVRLSQQNYTTVQYAYATVGATSDTVNVRLDMRPASTLGIGSFSETLTLQVCYDYTCTREVNGSPLSLQVNYAVTSAA